MICAETQVKDKLGVKTNKQTQKNRQKKSALFDPSPHLLLRDIGKIHFNLPLQINLVWGTHFIKFQLKNLGAFWEICSDYKPVTQKGWKLLRTF